MISRNAFSYSFPFEFPSFISVFILTFPLFISKLRYHCHITLPPSYATVELLIPIPETAKRFCTWQECIHGRDAKTFLRGARRLPRRWASPPLRNTGCEPRVRTRRRGDARMFSLFPRLGIPVACVFLGGNVSTCLGKKTFPRVPRRRVGETFLHPRHAETFLSANRGAARISAGQSISRKRFAVDRMVGKRFGVCRMQGRRNVSHQADAETSSCFVSASAWSSEAGKRFAVGRIFSKTSFRGRNSRNVSPSAGSRNAVSRKRFPVAATRRPGERPRQDRRNVSKRFDVSTVQTGPETFPRPSRARPERRGNVSPPKQKRWGVSAMKTLRNAALLRKRLGVGRISENVSASLGGGKRFGVARRRNVS